MLIRLLSIWSTITSRHSQTLRTVAILSCRVSVSSLHRVTLAPPQHSPFLVELGIEAEVELVVHDLLAAALARVHLDLHEAHAPVEVDDPVAVPLPLGRRVVQVVPSRAREAAGLFLIRGEGRRREVPADDLGDLEQAGPADVVVEVGPLRASAVAAGEGRGGEEGCGGGVEELHCDEGACI
ncbi:hypothetical protein Micbo1qcDRAFT_12856 [Microdochium bolleyi]|uniref:Uncharacterized protein n=1 Tax=Microdochium bolleyi TaxID=196109 RepID=A0A136IXN4_9PEZI|nr:hypothetical protein Micbo1qcDRAFT_12856 [Microdochium bolleyi]